jgi:hypothetical protein
MTPHARRPGPALAFVLASLVPALPNPVCAQDRSGVTLDLGDPPPVATADTIPTAVLGEALARFNAPGTTRIFGGIQLNTPVDGSVGVYLADVRISTHVSGDVVVLNGSLRLDAAGRIDGTITILGGRFFADSGAAYRGPVVEYRARANIRQAADTRLVAAPPPATLQELAGRMSVTLRGVSIAPRIGLGVYNRVEGLPVRLGPTLQWQPVPDMAARLDADLILRSAPNETDTRDGLGWWIRGTLTRQVDRPLRFGLEGGSRVEATADMPLSPGESSLSALIFRRDRHDWFNRRQLGAFAEWQVRPALALTGRLDASSERSVAAVDAFSILRSDESWRPNPLIDDGKFTTISVGAMWDTRDDPRHPRDGWWLHGMLRHTTSGDLTPVLLPDQIRDPLPSEGYETWELGFDLRRYLVLDPRHTLHLRVMGQGWLGGDPLTIQRRLALGGDDFLPGYDFRAVSCDARRRPDPATPALCDRRMMAQVEFRRTVDVRLGSRVGPYAIGVDRADLIVFADFGSAWLAGDGPGQVPTGRIQSLGEWRGDIGAGFDGGWFGAYLARAVTDDEPFRLSFRLSRRF